MSSLNTTQAMFDPLSTMDASTEGTSAPLQTTLPAHPAPAAAAAAAVAASNSPDGAGAPSEYDSFMTARSGMSYMTASHTGGPASSMDAAAGAPPPAKPAAAPPPSLFHRLPDRPPPPPPPEAAAATTADRSNRFLYESGNAPPPQLPQPLPPAVLDDDNPFGASATSTSSYNQPPPRSQQQTFTGPLSFGEDAPSATSTTFAMPLDLYDTPETIGRSSAAATAAPAPARLPPLYDFAREFSRVLPVSEDPASPVDVAATAAVPGWYDNGSSPSGGGATGASGGAASQGTPLGWGGDPSKSAISGAGAAAAPAMHGAGGWGSSSAAAPAGGALSSYAAAALLTNTVSVHSPRKLVAPSRIPGMSEPYMVYKVTSRSAISPETTVDRRFRDVVALAELLQTLYPGCFVPPRPSRNAVEGRRMQAAFLEERRAGIEKFLRRLVVHPVLGPSEATQVWLHAPSSDLRTSLEWLRLQPAGPQGLAKSTAKLLFQVVGRERTVPSPLEVTRPAAAAEDMYRLVHERTAQLRGVLKRVQPSAMEEKLREEAATLQERSEALLAVSRKADALVARSVKCSRVAEDLGTALAAEGDAELAAAGAAPEAVGPTPAAALRVAAEGFTKVGKLYGVATDASAKHLAPLHDWLAAVPGAAAALAARERCLLTLATLESDGEEAKGRLAEAEARAGGVAALAAAAAAGTPPTSAMRKIDALRLQVSQLAAAVTAAKDEYERVGSRNLSELAAFKAHMSRELADAVREYALVQLAAAQKAHDIWGETANQLATIAAAAAGTLAAAAPGGRVVVGGGGAGVGRSSSGVAIGVGLGAGGSSGTAPMYGGAYDG